jgi:hypothetical protein
MEKIDLISLHKEMMEKDRFPRKLRNKIVGKEVWRHMGGGSAHFKKPLTSNSDKGASNIFLEGNNVE